MTTQVRSSVAHFQEHRWPPHAFCRWNLDVAIAADAKADVAASEARAPVGCEPGPRAGAPWPHAELCWISCGFTQLGTGTIGPVVEHGVPAEQDHLARRAPGYLGPTPSEAIALLRRLAPHSTQYALQGQQFENVDSEVFRCTSDKVRMGR